MLQTLLFIFTVIKMTNSQYLEPGQPINFSIRVEEIVTGEAGLCIRVFCSFTVPQSVSGPIRRTWFKGDPRNPTVEVPYINTNLGRYPHEKECSFMLKFLVPGESDGEYRLKLEWGQGQEHIFPHTVNVTVKELKQKPTIQVPLLTEGQKAEINCMFTMNCVGNIQYIVWTGIEPEKVTPGARGVPGRELHFSTMIFHPKPKHHDTNVTCRVTFGKRFWTEATVTLEVRYAPKILNGSRCLVWGDELTCMCVSSGVPLPHITWPILDGVTEYHSAFSFKNTICISNISIPRFRKVNDTIECVSKNVIGMTKKEIQVLSHLKKPDEVSWSLSTSWILFTLSVLLNIIIASCLIVVLWSRKKRQLKPKDDDHVYMTSLKRDESVYETIKI